MTDTQFRAWLAADVKTYGSQKEAARIYGISAPYLGDILHGRRDPSKNFLDAVGFEKRCEYVKKGS